MVIGEFPLSTDSLVNNPEIAVERPLELHCLQYVNNYVSIPYCYLERTKCSELSLVMNMLIRL